MNIEITDKDRGTNSIVFGVDGSPLVNYTVVKNQIANSSQLEGAYPRWIALA